MSKASLIKFINSELRVQSSYGVTYFQHWPKSKLCLAIWWANVVVNEQLV